MTKLPAQSEWLRAGMLSPGVGVDREKGILRGFVVAQEGPFKSEGRGEFDLKALKSIVTLMNKAGSQGLKSRFAHPTLSGDGLGKFLGRAKNPQLGQVRLMRDGKEVLLNAVRADLHFDQTALEEPPGGGKPLGIYVMDLAESDPDALSSSLALKADQEEQLDPTTRRPLLDAAGKPRPPLWRPKVLHATDIVDTGDAVDGLLSAELNIEGLPDELVRRASQLLSQAFPNADREAIAARVDAWRDRYLAWRFGDEPADAPEPTEDPTAAIAESDVAARRRRLQLLARSY